MRTHKLLLIPALIFAFFCVSATNSNEPSKSESKADAKVQCGVNNSQIISYLQNCSHHHTITGDVVNIPGTCNSMVPIENCKIATVYVSDGIIVFHGDGYSACQ
jgi:hypothetical protein